MGDAVDCEEERLARVGVTLPSDSHWDADSSQRGRLWVSRLLVAGPVGGYGSAREVDLRCGVRNGDVLAVDDVASAWFDWQVSVDEARRHAIGGKVQARDARRAILFKQLDQVLDQGVGWKVDGPIGRLLNAIWCFVPDVHGHHGGHGGGTYVRLRQGRTTLALSLWRVVAAIGLRAYAG